MYAPAMVTYREAQQEFREVTKSPRKVAHTVRKYGGPKLCPRPGSSSDKPWVEPFFWETLISLLNEDKITIA